MRLVHSILGLTCLLSTPLLVGCGGPPAQAPHASDRAASLALFVASGRTPAEGELRAKLVEGLLARGYTVTDVASKADVVVSSSMTLTQRAPSPFQIRVNGRLPPPSFDAHVVVTAEGSGLVVGTGSVEYAADGGPSQEQVEKLCTAITGPRLEQFAETHPGSGARAMVASNGPPAPSPAGHSVKEALAQQRGSAASTAAPANEATPAVMTSPASGSPVSAAASTADAAAADTFVTGQPQPGAYAIVVGVEGYHSESLAPPPGAKADAKRFAKLAKTSLGMPERQVILLLDATKAEIDTAIKRVVSSVPAQGRVYFYFSGHGAPDPTDPKTSYLIPSDGNPAFFDQSAITLSHVMESLKASQAKDVIAFVDACFSGSGARSTSVAGTRGVPRVRLAAQIPNSSAIFTASGPNEVAGDVPGLTGGLFTKYLLQGLGSGQADVNGDQQVSLKELKDWVTPRVERDSRQATSKPQNPDLSSSGMDVGATMLEFGLPAR